MKTTTRLLSSSKPEKLNISLTEGLERLWQLPLASLPIGIYRVDLEVANGVAWRQFFKIAE